MKINQSILGKIWLSILLCGLFSCEKTLEEKPLSFLLPKNFYNNEEDAKTAINSVYSALYTNNLYFQPMWNLIMLDDDHVSGADWYLGTSGAGNPQAYWGVDGPWIGCYTIISRANIVLENITKINDNIDTIIKKRILGEAYFFRGWAYFQLVQLYGKVPLRLQSLVLNPTIFKMARSSIIDVYQQIITDFKNAESNLLSANNPKSGEVGRVTRGVAKGFLAKTYLTMASGATTGKVQVRGGSNNSVYEYEKNIVIGLETISAKDYFILARDKALEVINSGEYSLFNNWPDLWAQTNRNKTEHMWELQAVDGTIFVNELHNYMSSFSTFGRGAMWFTNNHYKDYDTTDTRVLNGVSHNYEMNNAAKSKYYYPSWQAYKYRTINGITYANNGTTDDRAYTIKYSDVSNPTISKSDAHFPMMRFAEMYLIVAEADNEINNAPTVQAYAMLNIIRNRARSQTTPANLSRDEFRSYVIAERAREFVFEGIRRFDLLRWGIYLQVMNKIGVGQNNINKVRNTRNLLLPIPQSELNSNSLISENNPGW